MDNPETLTTIMDKPETLTTRMDNPETLVTPGTQNKATSCIVFGLIQVV